MNSQSIVALLGSALLLGSSAWALDPAALPLRDLGDKIVKEQIPPPTKNSPSEPKGTKKASPYGVPGKNAAPAIASPLGISGGKALSAPKPDGRKTADKGATTTLGLPTLTPEKRLPMPKTGLPNLPAKEGSPAVELPADASGRMFPATGAGRLKTLGKEGLPTLKSPSGGLGNALPGRLGSANGATGSGNLHGSRLPSPGLPSLPGGAGGLPNPRGDRPCPPPAPGVPPIPGCGGPGGAVPGAGHPGPRDIPDYAEVASPPRVETVEHREGRQVYEFAGDLVPYSAESLSRCLALDPEGDTVVALRGRNLAAYRGGDRRVVLEDRRGRSWDLPVISASDDELLVRIPQTVSQGVYGGRTSVRGVEFHLKKGPWVEASHPAPLCDRKFQLRLQARYENCLDPVRSWITDAGLRLEGLDTAGIPWPDRDNDGTGTTLTWNLTIREGQRGNLRLIPPRSACGLGRWTTDSITVGPARHGDNRLEVNVTHRTEPVTLEANDALLNGLVGRLLNLRIRLHNYSGNPRSVEENASWIRIGIGRDERTFRFTIPPYKEELTLMPELVAYVNDLNSRRSTLSFRPEGERMAITLEIEFESEGVEIKNYAYTFNPGLGMVMVDDLYPDAHIDNLRVTVNGLALGWDEGRSQPVVTGSPEVQVTLDFDLRGLGEIVEALWDIEGRLKRRIADKVQSVLSNPEVRQQIDQGLQGMVERLRELRGAPPVARFLEARAEGSSFVIRYIPATR